MTATTADFSIKRDMPNTGEIDVLPVLFWDDFSWVEADWGEQQLNGQLAEIMPWYASVDPPTANSAAQREQQWTSLKNQEHIAIRDSKGYLTPGTFQPTGTARFIFFRTGMINSARPNAAAPSARRKSQVWLPTRRFSSPSTPIRCTP